MALEAGIWFLVNIGYGGPIAEEVACGGMTCPSLHRWPPSGLTDATPRLLVIRQVLHSAQGLDTAASEKLGSDIDALTKRADDTIFTAEFDGKADPPLVANGTCLVPALMTGDPIVELLGQPIGVGDIVAVVLRGTLLPLIKVFAGVIDREGFPAALFYLKHPEQMIEVPLHDVLYARKIQAPREFDGNSLLAEADPFVEKWCDRYHQSDTMAPVGKSRTSAWVESMVSIFGVLRAQPQ